MNNRCDPRKSRRRAIRHTLVECRGDAPGAAFFADRAGRERPATLQYAFVKHGKSPEPGLTA
ncbi:hypothetical protein [Burkholderia plantarii]|uniref:hypothetical protein n=1 Tax=Burkholderia plantarii TaxID=41899 RepID=UPI0013147FD0|nr:hypothetical protein [Burkholderia plantarii]WLE58114.1 hypothetical protein GIY62_13305 [Burkholderia plantarii]